MENLTKHELQIIKNIIHEPLYVQHNVIVAQFEQTRRYQLQRKNVLDYDNDIDEIEFQKCHNISSDERWYVTSSFIRQLR